MNSNGPNGTNGNINDSNIIPHSRPLVSHDDITAVATAVRSGMHASGPEVAAFEQEIAERVMMPYAVATNSGTSALFLSLRALGVVKNGLPVDEVIIPSYVCISLISACQQAGAQPVIADCRSDSPNPSLDAIMSAITSHTRAIIVPHMFGDPLPRDGLERLISTGIPVIEDIALSLGASYDDRPAGSIADVTVCSFYATKMISAGYGGMVLAKSQDVYRRLRSLLQTDNRSSWGESYALRLTDLQAALGRSQLSRIGKMVARRRAIAAQYDAVLGNRAMRRAGSVYCRYIVEVPDVPAAQVKMRDLGIVAERPVYRPLHHYVGMRAPNADAAWQRYLSIPCYPSLNKREVERVCSALGSL